MIDKIIVENRQRRNTEALVIEASGQGGRKGTHAALAATPTPEAAPNARNPRKARHNDEGDSSDNSDTSTESDKSRLRKLEWKDRCCIRHLWGQCREETDGGGCRFGPHIKHAPELTKTHKLYLALLAENGAPEEHKPQGGQKGKGKDKGKGKGKGKDAAPAVAADAAELSE